MKKLIILLAVFVLPQMTFAAMADDPLLFYALADELETDDSDNDVLSWNAQAWIGDGLDKFWFKTEGERSHGETESAEIQALYSKAISTYWDIQAGLRHDAEPAPTKDWAVLGLQGLAPYFFEMDAALFVAGSGDTSFRFSAEYEILLTQKLILRPEIELNFFGQNMREINIGSGLAESELRLVLRYEIRRQFAPYIGISHKKLYGKTSDYAVTNGRESRDTNIVMGLRLWF
jgi:copper resistance protein B